MDLLLVRHAQPAWTHRRAARVDPTLTELGRKQAAALARWLTDADPFDQVLVSTAVRAQETLEPLRAHLGQATIEDAPWLHEIRYPTDWEGSPVEEIERLLAQARSRPRDEWWHGMPGGESFRDFHARVTSGLDAYLTSLGLDRDAEGLWSIPDDAPRRVLAVAHAGTNSVVLGHLLGLPPEPWEWERFSSDHASVTWLSTTTIAGRAIFSLQRFSDVAHLPPGLVTG